MFASTPLAGNSVIATALQRVKLTVQRFDDDEQGMNTVEAIILLFVAAIVLLVFFTLIWPLIRDTVMEQLNNLFSQDGST